MPFDIAPIQIAFIIIEQSEQLVNYYQEIYDLLSVSYRCQLYAKNSRVNLNILQADKEGCPFKIILGKEELVKEEITLVRRDNVERKITVSLKDDEIGQRYFSAYEKYMESLDEIDNGEVKKALVNKGIDRLYQFKKNFKLGKLFSIIEKEKAEFQKSISQKSIDFRDSHIFSIDNISELEKKISDGVKGLFLIPFCNNLDCEEKIKEKVVSYSIRCIPLFEKSDQVIKKCLFCQSSTSLIAYLGRSY